MSSLRKAAKDGAQAVGVAVAGGAAALITLALVLGVVVLAALPYIAAVVVGGLILHAIGVL